MRATIFRQERIDELIHSKRALSNELLEGGGEAALTELSDAELMRDRAAENEPYLLFYRDLVDLHALIIGDHLVDGGAERLGIAKQGRDIAEHDSRLGKSGIVRMADLMSMLFL